MPEICFKMKVSNKKNKTPLLSHQLIANICRVQMSQELVEMEALKTKVLEITIYYFFS